MTSAVLPILEDKHNHLIDALRYALEGTRRIQQQKPPKVVILPTANRW
jgi:phage terminase large subunit